VVADQLEHDAIRTAALDYIEGWYSGDPGRMRQSLHPELAKRIQRQGPGGRLAVENLDAETLVQLTAGGTGKTDPRKRSDAAILDVFGRAASVRVDAGAWVDFLHMIKTDEGWKIINVLWELRDDTPTPAQRTSPIKDL
jgi:hypothetical protein